MKAIVCEKFAPVDELTYQELPDPVAKAGEIVVDINAIGVNYPDGLMVQGLYQMKPPFPFVPGSEAAGTVSQVGEGVSHLKEGDRVIALGMLGMYASKAAINARMCFPIPKGISDEEAAGLLTAHATAHHHALRQRANLQAGETLLVTGAAGGTGLAAVKLVKPLVPKLLLFVLLKKKSI